MTWLEQKLRKAFPVSENCRDFDAAQMGQARFGL